MERFKRISPRGTSFALGLILLILLSSQLAQASTIASGTIYINAAGTTAPMVEAAAFVAQSCAPSADVKTGVTQAVISIAAKHGASITVSLDSALREVPNMAINIAGSARCEVSTLTPRGVAKKGAPAKFTAADNFIVLVLQGVPGFDAVGVNYTVSG